MNSIKNVEKYLKEFCRLHMGINSLELSKPLDIKGSFEDEYPDGEFPGVYVLSNKNNEVVRIGHTGRSFDIRLDSYFVWHKTPSVGSPANKEGKGARYVRTIPFGDDLKYMRLSLEEFLIERIKPINNQHGK